ncbi:MAG: GTP-binding protein [Sulfolobaceae archaeon]|nr:GTP-binding protein [Sulfolobaceae archaeon]
MKLPKEDDSGNREYKLLIPPNINEQRLQELATQLKYRLEEGGGEAFYIIGVDNEGTVIGLPENELNESIKNIEKVCELVNAKIVYKRIAEVKKDRYVAELLIRNHRSSIPIQINVAIMGHVNAGKSTLTGALILGKLDDGNGMLRAQVARYLHEVITGRTSSITLRLLGFDDSGNSVNWKLRDPLDEAEVALNSSKVIRLIDLGGHERYLRTTLKGLLGYEVDYVMLVIGADDGLSAMGKEHLAIASVLKFPVFAVITKVDKYPEDRITRIINELKSVLRIPGINRLAMVVNEEDELSTAVMAMRTNKVVPIFKVSNVTGYGLDLLRKFLNMLQPRPKLKSSDTPLVYIDETYSVTGVGTVVLGSVVRGRVATDDQLLIGPDNKGEFKEVRVKSIQVDHVFTDYVNSGTIATFALQGINREDLRKGMVMTKGKPKGVRTFKANVIVLHHPTTIKTGYVSTIHLYTIRQAARFENITKGLLRTGDSSEVVLHFLYKPEYVEKGQIFIFREGRTRGLGVITEILS